jgi:two-component sensor histidine kinase
LSLGLHELATNAIKYGALSKPGGSIDIDWGLDGETFRMSWIEKDGPKVVPPAASGFGTRLLERALASEIGGKVRLDYLADGLRCDIEGRIADAGEEATKV